MSKLKIKELAVVCAFLNEEQNLSHLVNAIVEVTKNLQVSLKFIFVDDGSLDGTWEEIKIVCRKFPNSLGIKLIKNFGQHSALLAGISHTTCEWAIIMDSDLQDDPSAIPSLIEEAEKGYLGVFVNRIDRNENLIYLTLQRLFYFIISKISGISFDPRQANYSLIHKNIINAFCDSSHLGVFYLTRIKQLGFKLSSVNFRQGKRLYSKSKYNLKKRINLAVQIMVSFSNKFMIKQLILFINFFTVIIFSISFFATLYLGESNFINYYFTLILVILGLVIYTLIVQSIFLNQLMKKIYDPIYVIEEIYP